ncbi:MAG: hypothetical protein ABI718_10070 [Acidobacteriota bacterium]
MQFRSDQIRSAIFTHPKRTAVALGLFLMIVGSFEPFYVRIFFSDRDALRRLYVELPYRKLPGFRPLLSRVRELTPLHAKVALWVPPGRWNEGYEYGYYRSVYLIAGREVVPLLDAADHFLSSNLDQADYLVCWHCNPGFAGFKTVLRTPDGFLARKR